MAEPRQTRLRKNAKSTAIWRENRKKSGVPEARQIDKALLLAFTHVMGTKGDVVLDRTGFAHMLSIAYEILGHSHDIEKCQNAVAKRLSDHKNSNKLNNIRGLRNMERLAYYAEA